MDEETRAKLIEKRRKALLAMPSSSDEQSSHMGQKDVLEQARSRGQGRIGTPSTARSRHTWGPRPAKNAFGLSY
jgi:hypothetical protein